MATNSSIPFCLAVYTHRAVLTSLISRGVASGVGIDSSLGVGRLTEILGLKVNLPS